MAQARVDAAVEPDQEGVDHQDQGGGYHHAGEHAGGVEVLARVLDQEADALVADQELADDGSADRAGKRDLERGEEERQQRVPHHLARDGGLARAQHAGHVDQAAVNVTDAGENGDEHGVEYEEPHQP